MFVARVLVVEDDGRTAELLEELLVATGFSPTCVATGEEAVARQAAEPFALVVLDVGLPGMDGFATCRALRSSHQVPILMLTARGDIEDRVVGLETGADDYLAKPFDPRELVARMRALLRRSPPDGEQVLRRGPLALDPGARSVTLDERPIELTTTEFDLLRVLVTHAGRTVERERLMELARGEGYGAFDRSIDVHVSHLRRKLGDDPRRPRLIKTIHGVGYVFVGGPREA